MPVKAHEFVGRSQELNIIENAIRHDGLHIVCLHGDGGIGKTSILREVIRRYKDIEGIILTPIIDFYKAGTHTALSLIKRIADQFKQIKSDTFTSFETAYQDLEKMSAAGVSPTRLHSIEQLVYQEFFISYNSIAQTKRPIILIDTIEIVQTAEVISWLRENLVRFSNTIVLLAGRRNDELYASIVPLLKDRQRAQLIILQPFELEETEKLFTISDVGSSLPIEVQEKVQILSRGRPILLTLALDWKRRVPSEELTPTVAQYTLSELRSMDEKILDAVRMQFEEELVSKITGLDPESQLFFHMAYVHRRFNAEIWAFLQGIDVTQAQGMLNLIREYSFVKYFEEIGEYYLHDEMRRLILQHVCPKIDWGWELRKEYAQKMAELTAEERQATRQLFESGRSETDSSQFSYYGQKLWENNQEILLLSQQGDQFDVQTKLNDLQTIQRVLEAERVYYWLAADRDTGLALYREAFIDNIWSHQREACELKQTERNLAVTDISWAYPPHEVRYEQALLAYLHDPNSDQCLKILDNIEIERLMAQGQINHVTFVGHYWIYRSFAYSGFDVEKARQSAEKAIELLENNRNINTTYSWLLDQALARAYYALAYANRLAQYHAQAAEAYQKSVHYIRGSSAIMFYADTLNAMAYVYGLLDQYLTAKPLCEKGLMIRQRLKQDYSEGLSYSTLGLIYLFENHLDMAQAKCEVALTIFERLNDPWGLGLAHIGLARVMNVLAERSLGEIKYTSLGLERERVLDFIRRGFEHAYQAEKLFAQNMTRRGEVYQTLASLSRLQAKALLAEHEKSNCISMAHGFYAQAQVEYEKSRISLEQAFVLERWSRLYFDQQDYQGWMEKIHTVEKIAIQQTGDLRNFQHISSVERREFLHVWGKIERAYGINAWLQHDLETIAEHFTWACAFLEEYSTHSQTFRDTLDALTDILSDLSTTELNLIASKITSIRQQKGLQKYIGIVERVNAATGIMSIFDHA